MGYGRRASLQSKMFRRCLFLVSPRGENKRHAEQRRRYDQLAWTKARRRFRHQRNELRQPAFRLRPRGRAPLERQRQQRKERHDDRDRCADQRSGDRSVLRLEPEEQRREQPCHREEDEQSSDEGERGRDRDAARRGLRLGLGKRDEFMNYRLYPRVRSAMRMPAVKAIPMAASGFLRIELVSWSFASATSSLASSSRPSR